MKKTFQLFLVIIIIFSNFCQAQTTKCVNALWAKNTSNSGSYDNIIFMRRDAAQNIYILGSYNSGPYNAGNITLANAGSTNFFIAKLDTSGTVLDAKRVAYGSGITANDFNIDNLGNAYVSYSFTGTATIADSLLTGISYNEAVCVKYKSDFTKRWLTTNSWSTVYGDGGGDKHGKTVAVDKDYNVYFVGSYDAQYFKIQNVTITNPYYFANSTDDTFLAKLDSTGHLIYLNTIGGGGADVPKRVMVDSSGTNLYIIGVTGPYNGSSMGFDSYIFSSCPNANSNLYAAKYRTSDGKCLWGKTAGGYATYQNIYAYDAVIGDNSSLYLTGNFTGPMTMFGKYVNSADTDPFLLKLDSNGVAKWVLTAGGTSSSEYGYSISYHNGYIGTYGRLNSNRPFVFGTPLYTNGTSTFYSYSAKLKADGTLVWARGNTNAISQILDNDNNLIIAGGYAGSFTWYPKSLTTGTTAKGFMVKYIEGGTPAFSVTAGPDKNTNCATSIQLSGATSPPTGINVGWWPDVGFSGQASKTPNVAPAINTTYYLSGYYLGCTSIDTVSVSVNNTLNVSLSNYNPSMCRGDSVQVTGSTAQTGVTFSWLPTNYASTGSQLNNYFKSPVPTVYILTSTMAGCKDYDTVYVNTKPRAYVNMPYTDIYYGKKRYAICQGTSKTLTAGTVDNTYTWNNNSIITSTNNENFTVGPSNTSSGGYVVATANNVYNCPAKDSVAILNFANQAAPVVNYQPSDRSACPGDSVIFNSALTGTNYYPFQYSWYSGFQVDSLDGQGFEDIEFYPTVNQTFLSSAGFTTYWWNDRLTIMSVNANQDGFKFRCWFKDICSARGYSDTVTLSVGPKITTQPLDTKVFCQNHTDSININSSSSGATYLWERYVNGFFTPIQPGGVLIPNGRYLRVVSPQDSLEGVIVRCKINGCSNLADSYSNPFTIHVVNIPTIIAQSTNDTICYNTPFQVYVNTNSGPYTFKWYEGNTALAATSYTPVITNDTLKVYNYGYGWHKFVCKITSTGCNNIIYSDTIRVFIAQKPTVNYFAVDTTMCSFIGPITLYGGYPAGGVYSGPGVSNDLFYPSTAGNGTHVITYTYTNSYNCSASDVRNYTVTICTDFANINNNISKPYLLHNISDDQFTIINPGDTWQVNLYDMSGRIIKQIKITRGITEISNSDLASGVYNITFNNGKEILNQKIVLNK